MVKILHFLKEKKAQSMAEFALILPIIVILVGMIISGGQALFIKLSLQMATYEGARVGITEPNFASAKTEAKATIKDFLEDMPLVNEDDVGMTFRAPNGWVKGKPFIVETTYSFKTLFPVPGTTWDVVGTKVQVGGKIEMSIENAP